VKISPWWANNCELRHYASVLSRSRQGRLTTAHAEATEQVSIARKAWDEAKTDLLTFVDSHFESLLKRPEPTTSAVPRGPLLASPGPAAAKEEGVEKTAADETDAPRIDQLQRRLVLLEARRDDLGEKLTDAHPELLAVDDEIKTIRKQVTLLREETAKPAGPKAAPRESAEAAAPAISPAPDVAGQRVRFDSRKTTLARAETDYQEALAKQQAAAGTLVSASPIQVRSASGCRVVPGTPSLDPHTVLISVFAGFIVGLGILLLGRARTVFRPITTPEEAEAALGVPVAGIVPSSTSSGRRAVPRERILLTVLAFLLLIIAGLFVSAAGTGRL